MALPSVPPAPRAKLAAGGLHFAGNWVSERIRLILSCDSCLFLELHYRFTPKSFMLIEVTTNCPKTLSDWGWAHDWQRQGMESG